MQGASSRTTLHMPLCCIKPAVRRQRGRVNALSSTAYNSGVWPILYGIRNITIYMHVSPECMVFPWCVIAEGMYLISKHSALSRLKS